MKRFMILACAALVLVLSSVPASAQDDLTQTATWDEYDVQFSYPPTFAGESLAADDFYFIPSDDGFLSDENTIGQLLALRFLEDTRTLTTGDFNGGFDHAVDVLYDAIYDGDPQARSFEDFAADVTTRNTTVYGDIPVIRLADEDETFTYALVFNPNSISEAIAVGILNNDPSIDVDADEDLLVAIADTIIFNASQTSVAPVDATPGDGILVIGETEIGVITDTQDELTFTFTGNVGDVVTIAMTADNENELDTYLELYNEDGNLVAQNDDDGSGSLNSQINYVVQEDGQYTINATRFDGAGQFTITLTNDDLNANVITYGDVVRGELSDSTGSIPYLFDAQAGDTVVISMVADDTDELDTYLELYGPDGDVLAENDDFQNLNSQIEFLIPANGTYIIVATRFGGEGAFTLTLDAFVSNESAPSGNDATDSTSDSASGFPDVPTNDILPASGDFIFIDDFENTISLPANIVGAMDDTTPEHVLYFDGVGGQTVTVTFQALSGELSNYVIQFFDGDISNEAVDDENNIITYTVTLLDNGQYGVYILSSAFEADSYVMTIE